MAYQRTTWRTLEIRARSRPLNQKFGPPDVAAISPYTQALANSAQCRDHSCGDCSGSDTICANCSLGTVRSASPFCDAESPSRTAHLRRAPGAFLNAGARPVPAFPPGSRWTLALRVFRNHLRYFYLRPA